MLQISRKSIKAYASYSDFKKCCEKKKKEKKNTKKIRQTLKANISGTAWQTQLKFRIGGAPPRGNLLRKIHVFSWSVKLQMHENSILFTCVKCTLVCHAPGVFWASRHITASRFNKASNCPLPDPKTFHFANSIPDFQGIYLSPTK